MSEDDGARSRVEPLGLNLRSAPVVEASTKLAVLPRGKEVERLGAADVEGWIRVATRIEGARVEGFVAERFLEPVDQAEEPASEAGVRAVHLREDHPASRRDRAGGRAFPIGESDRPGRNPDAPREERVRQLVQIVDWLDVENSARYRATGTSTYCNVYAHDYCYLANVCLPRVWWTGPAIGRLRAGEAVSPAYGETVRELNANALFDWLCDFGSDFGWERTFPSGPGVGGLQEAANAGGVGLIVGQRRELNRPGHVTVVVPEHGPHGAARSDGRVTRPLQSQAGSRNRAYTTHHWWTQPRFREFGFWAHDPRT